MSDEHAMEVYAGQAAPAATQQSGETAALVLAAREKALVEARYIVAMRQPRNMDVVREKLLKECKRPGFAKTARYHKPIGKGIEGPSIRFAEAAIQAMGNVTIDTPTILDDTEKRIMRVTVNDVEANVSYSLDVTIRKAVERRSYKDGDTVLGSRTNSKGEKTYLVAATDDDVLNKQNALVSKAVRTLGLRLVPGWLLDECMAQVKRVAADEDAKDPTAARRAIFDAFAGIGITAEMLIEYLGGESESLTTPVMNELRGLFAALRDGEATWREAMDAKHPSASASSTSSTATGVASSSDPKPLAEAIKAKAKAAANASESAGSVKSAEPGTKGS